MDINIFSLRSEWPRNRS